MTVWLAVIAIASVLQVLLLAGAAVAAAVGYRRAAESLTSLRQQTLAPVVQRVNTVLDDVHQVAGRVQQADEQVRDAAGRVGQAAVAVGTRFWPVLGIARAVRAAVTSRRSGVLSTQGK